MERTASTSRHAGAGRILSAAWRGLARRLRRDAAAQARLLEWQSRVRPHFLFNSLNTAVALVRLNPRRAETLLEDLSELFRAALAALGQESTLGAEIRLARRYLAIEAARFGKRLRVEWRIDPAVVAARVPPLVLQPLVENAVRHGVAPNPEGGAIHVRACVRGGRVRLQMTNTVARAADPGHGIGLASVREQLRLMHRRGAEFEAGPTPDGRYRVRLSVPLPEPEVPGWTRCA